MVKLRILPLNLNSDLKPQEQINISGGISIYSNQIIDSSGRKSSTNVAEFTSIDNGLTLNQYIDPGSTYHFTHNINERVANTVYGGNVVVDIIH